MRFVQVQWRFCALLLTLLLGGCATESKPEPVVVPDVPPVAQAGVSRKIGESVEGRPIEAVTFGEGARRVLIIASIHGNEPAGTPLTEMLIEHLRDHPEVYDKRQVIIVPRANPDGLESGTRYNKRGVDLNRNFPAANRTKRRSGDEPLSEPESRALHGLIVELQPACIVSIHQPVACVDYDGPARTLATFISKACGLPVKKLGAQPGSMGSFAGVEQKIPIVTLELPKSATTMEPHALWTRYGPALLVAIYAEVY